MNDDLFQPSLQDSHTLKPKYKPWSSRAQLMVAFFGGTFAFTLFAHKNNQRLSVKEPAQKKMLQLGIFFTGLTLIIPIVIALFWPAVFEEDIRMIRYLNRGIALGLYYWVESIQRPFLRTTLITSDDEPYAPAWRDGLIHVFGWGTLHGVVLGIVITTATTLTGGI